MRPTRALAFVLLVLRAGASFAASPAPKPSAADIEAWGRIVDTVYTAEKMKGVSIPTALGLTGAGALRLGRPALGEACFRRAFAADPGLASQAGDVYLRAAMELARQPEKKAALAPFILLYLDLAEAKGAKGMVLLSAEVKALRTELAAAKSPPPARETPSVASLREVAVEQERWARKELARAKYLRTSGDLRSIGTAFEAYAVDNNRYPVGSAGAIEKKLSPTYIGKFPKEDAWGTPFRLETSADGKHYRIQSAGADGAFETLPRLGSTAGPSKRTVDDAARDVVFEDGELVQVQSEKAFDLAAEAGIAAPGPPPDAASLAEREAARNTMASIRNIATAMEAYRVDKGSYPSGWPETLEHLLVPKYIHEFPRLDGWGTPFAISSGGQSKRLRIVSAGSDRVFEPIPYIDPETSPPLRHVSDPVRDIVFEEGTFIQQLGPGPFSGTGRGKARQAPEPSAVDVATWSAFLDGAFPSEAKPSPDSSRILGYLASEARRAGIPALSEAILRRILGVNPEARRKNADGIFEDAWALYRDEARWSETAPFILLYLDQAQRLRSREMMDRADVIAIARARLVGVDVGPRQEPVISGEALRRLRESGEARRAASDARGAAYKKTRTDMAAIGAALKAYRAKAKRYPDGDFAEAAGQLREFAKGALPRTDAWGTEFRYESPRDGSTYRVWSAGFDRRFERLPPFGSPNAAVAFESDDPGGDIVIVPGEWLRELSTFALYASAPEPASPAAATADDANRYAHGRTLARIREVGDALNGYRNDQGTFPNVGTRLVEGSIPGVYISKVPTHDAWGTELRVDWSPDRRHFRIVSAGTDREFEKLGEVDPAAAWGPTSLVSDPNRDIVFQDGVFLQWYRDAR